MKFHKIICLIITFLSFISCEKEIQIDVDETDPKLVIEAQMSNRMGDAIVILTNSRNLNDSSSPEKITGAEIYITEIESQAIFTLNETEEGIYKNENLQGEIGKTYYLEILLPNGQTFSSLQTMPIMVDLHEVRYEEKDSPFADDEDDPTFDLRPIFMDPLGIDNYYQYIITRNGIKEKGIFINKDLGFDGEENSQRLSIEANYGDIIRVDLHNVTPSAYDFLLGAQLNLSQATATPTNPISNIEGDALGYFKVFSAGEPISFTLEE